MIFRVETAWEISTWNIICFHIRPMFGLLSVLASSTVPLPPSCSSCYPLPHFLAFPVGFAIIGDTMKC